MTALLDLPSVRSRVHPMSVDTYHRLAAFGLVDENEQIALTEAEPLSCAALPEFAVLLRDLFPAPRPQ